MVDLCGIMMAAKKYFVVKSLRGPEMPLEESFAKRGFSVFALGLECLVIYHFIR